MRQARADTYTRGLPRRLRGVVAILTLGWLATFVYFWTWWLDPIHRAGWAGLILNSALLVYLAMQPIVYLIAVNRMKVVNPAVSVPALRVAFVVTKAPSEPWPVARATLTAMLSQTHRPYDVWLCDEAPSPETVEWCARHQVNLSSRAGQEAYHRATWPRRTRCKEGNLAWFYDTWGYDRYDVVAQLDCDHVPAPGYLREILRPFADPAVGYVAAPSVCDSNADNSWSARGRLHREATFHGPYQTAHNSGLAPVCIGSHYAVRTQALAEIGGIGPELAEDFSTAFLLTSAGWQGAFAHRARARGEGPLTFAAMATQEFQWSRSMSTVLLGLAPRHLRRMPWQLRGRFLFALSYYPLQVAAALIGLGLTMAAAIGGFSWVRVDYIDFLLRWAALSLWLIALTWVLKSQNLLRPTTAPLFSWEGSLYMVTRWAWVTVGLFAAIRQRIRPTSVGFAVTPKTRDGLESLAVRLIRPYVGISLLLSTAALIGLHAPASGNTASGYVVLCLLAALAYAVAAVTVPLLHARESGRAGEARYSHAIRRTARRPLLVASICWPPLMVGWVQAIPHVLLLLT